jgi:hypothetical protein
MKNFYKNYEVVGGGELIINTGALARCGNAEGICIEVDGTWAKYPKSGGVLDRANVISLRDNLTEWLRKTKNKKVKK